jgi:hypothetical protein
MKELEIEYKRETGLQPFELIYFVNKRGHEDTRDVYSEEYIRFLEDEIINLRNRLSAVSIDYKSEHDDAVYEIGQLQDQLQQAEDEIRELNYEIKIRPQ